MPTEEEIKAMLAKKNEELGNVSDDAGGAAEEKSRLFGFCQGLLWVLTCDGEGKVK